MYRIRSLQELEALLQPAVEGQLAASGVVGKSTVSVSAVQPPPFQVCLRTSELCV